MRAGPDAVIHRRVILRGIGAALSACLLTACAGSTPPGPQQVGLSLIAPTSGATVNVRSITVLGHVTPALARVVIAGRHARVRKGTFRVRLVLPHELNHIGIVATAPGYNAATVETTIHYVGRRGASPGADYTDQAEVVCVAVNNRFGRLGPIDIVSQPRAALMRMAIEENMVKRLARITVPRTVEPAYRRFVARVQGYIQITSELEADVRDGNLANALVLRQRFDSAEPSLYNEASRLDIPDCGGTPIIPAQP